MQYKCHGKYWNKGAHNYWILVLSDSCEIYPCASGLCVSWSDNGFNECNLSVEESQQSSGKISIFRDF